MEFLYEISTSENIVIMSNFPDQYLMRFDIDKERVLTGICASTGKKIKHGFFQRKNYRIYLLTYDLNITNKIFRRYIDICEFFISSYIDAEKKMKDNQSRNFRRLKHNLVTYNTNILQELEKTFYTDGVLKGVKKQLDYIKNTLLSSTEEVAISILKIFKSANLMKSDFDVYDMISSNNPYVEFDNHSIHKVLKSVLSPFWLDFFEKKVDVQIGECNRTFNIDYKSISVVFTHLFDNAVKYICPGTVFNIDFQFKDSKVKIILEMTSLKIFPDELSRIFEENYSGEFAKKISKSGDGVGMYIVQKLIEMNKGKIQVYANVDDKVNENRMGIPFERNRIILELDSSQ